MGGGFAYQQEEEEDEAVYEIETSLVFALIPLETVSIPVSVDELDILSLNVGQNVSVSLDALPGYSFEGKLVRINPVGKNEDGGSMKYTVTVELERSEEMLNDMNASVRIEVSRREGVLTVPAAAVYEDGTRSYVCTALDEEGKPASPVDVVTGVSDGVVIEILEGIDEGLTVYYEYADSVSYDSGT